MLYFIKYRNYFLTKKLACLALISNNFNAGGGYNCRHRKLSSCWSATGPWSRCPPASPKCTRMSRTRTGSCTCPTRPRKPSGKGKPLERHCYKNRSSTYKKVALQSFHGSIQITSAQS